MRDQDKPKAQLIIELMQAREQAAALEASLEEYKRSGQRALERAIEEVKAAALKNFIGNLTGFVTTPLMLMKASLIALRDRPAAGVQAEQWQVFEAQIGYLERLFENILLMVRLDNLNELELGALNLSRLTQQVLDRLKPLADQRGHTLTFRPQADGPRVRADNYLLKSAIAAIVTNALDFTPPGGQIAVAVYTQDRIEAVIEVRDNGIGIDPDDMPHIFKRFWWANRADYPNPGSIGLGLALAKKIVELHNGRITVESARDDGSTFWVILPLNVMVLGKAQKS
jgi:signal transduction histidine kinase